MHTFDKNLWIVADLQNKSANKSKFLKCQYPTVPKVGFPYHFKKLSFHNKAFAFFQNL